MNFDWIGVWFNWFVTSDELNKYNAFTWIISNILVAYVSFALVLFVIAYYVLFNIKKTTAGRYVFKFFLSLFGIVGLIFISLFIDPTYGRQWNIYPGDVIWWRPTVRLVAYAYVSYTITSLAILLAVRKWRPDLLRTSNDRGIVETRKPDHI